MKSNIKRLSLCLSALMLLILASPLTVLAAEEEVAASAKFTAHSGRWFRRLLPLHWH